MVAELQSGEGNVGSEVLTGVNTQEDKSDAFNALIEAKMSVGNMLMAITKTYEPNDARIPRPFLLFVLSAMALDKMLGGIITEYKQATDKEKQQSLLQAIISLSVDYTMNGRSLLLMLEDPKHSDFRAGLGPENEVLFLQMKASLEKMVEDCGLKKEELYATDKTPAASGEG